MPYQANFAHKTRAATATAAPPIAPQLAAFVANGIAKPLLLSVVGALVPVGETLSPPVGAGVAVAALSFSRPAVIVTFKGTIYPAVGMWVDDDNLVTMPLPVSETSTRLVQSADAASILHSIEYLTGLARNFVSSYSSTSHWKQMQNEED